MTDAAMSPPRVVARRCLAVHLIGSGVELGPGHNPFEIPYSGVTVKYVDRWQPAENSELFAELGTDAHFPKPDLIANLDVDRLKSISDASVDFVIASHVFEHLAQPLGLLEDIHRVLRPGGVLLLLLPDRRRTFDSTRRPTSLEHLVDEYERGITEVDDDHVEDFLAGTTPYDPSITGEARRKLFDLHRARSIHVHCWSETEFIFVLEHAVRVMALRWELIEALFVDDVEDGIEFGYVLRRPDTELPLALTATRLRESWEALRERSEQQARLVLPSTHFEPSATEAELRAIVEQQEAQLSALRRLPIYPLLRAAWRIQQRILARRHH
jgi:SAM-dependent methyltransferase